MEKSRPLIYARFEKMETAVTWYRLEVPITGVCGLGLFDALVEGTGQLGKARSGNSLFDADIVWTHYTQGIDLVELQKVLGSRRRSWEGVESQRPLILYDVDDDLFDLMSPSHPEIPPIFSGPDGRRFSESQVERFVRLHFGNIAAADLIVCSTEWIQSRVLEMVPNAKTHVFLNLVPAFGEELVAHPASSQCRILWQGGANHAGALMEVVPILERIHQRERNVEIVLWGDPGEANPIPNTWTLLEPVPFRHFFPTLNRMGHDIALAPLGTDGLSAGRSANKFFESAFCWKPTACVARRRGIFEKEIRHGDTGMLFRNPEELDSILTRLIRDPGLRQQIAAQGRQACLSRLDVGREIGLLAERILRLLHEN